MSIKPYPDYQDSGSAWLGEIPKHWEIRPSKSVFGLRNERERVGDKHLTPSQTLGVMTQEEYMRVTGNKVVLALAGTAMKHVEENDFIIHLRSFQGGIEWSGYCGKVSPAYTVLYPRSAAVPSYFRYLLKSRGYVETIASLTDQLRDGQSMRYYDFGKTALPLPPPKEQRVIANFLDFETAEIDAFIADQEQLTSLLNERRAATITRAVTKGLDVAAPVRDSGVTWIGAIPEHWSTQRLSWLFQTISSGTTPPDDGQGYYDGDINWVTTGELREREIVQTSRTVTTHAVNSLSSLKIYPPGTLLIAMYGATIGRLGFLAASATTNQACCALSGPLGVNPRFVYYALLAGKPHLLLMADGGGQPNVNQDKLRSMRIPISDLEEQGQIVEYLDREIAEIDAAIADAREAIQLSKERRSAVISAAVTGKINVQKWMLTKQAETIQGESVGVAQ